MKNIKWNKDRELAEFLCEGTEKEIECAISMEALVNNFGGNPEHPMHSFYENQNRIESIALSLIQKQRFQEDGSILILSTDGI